jgi:hypothetical protein
VTLFRPICFSDGISLLPKRLASLSSPQRHNKSLNTGLAIRSRSLFSTGCSQPVKQTLAANRNAMLNNMNIIAIYKIMSKLLSVTSGLVVYSEIVPSILPNEIAIEHSIQPSIVNPKLVWFAIISIPVICCLQTKSRWLRALGWVLLCLLMVFAVTQ